MSESYAQKCFFYVGNLLDFEAAQLVDQTVCGPWDDGNMFPPDAHYVPMRTPFIPQCSSPHPPTLPHSVTLSSVTVKWVRWYWAKGLSALIFLSHSILIHSILLETIALIWDSHREHMWPLTCWGDISCVPFKVGCGTFLLDISSFRPLNVSSSEVCKMTQSRREMLAFVLQVCSYPWR